MHRDGQGDDPVWRVQRLFGSSGLRGYKKTFHSVGDLVSLSRPGTENILVFHRGKSPAFIAHPVLQEGTLATSLTLGRVAVDAAASSRALRAWTSGDVAYGEVVWS